jgi:hypothetical protein
MSLLNLFNTGIAGVVAYFNPPTADPVTWILDAQ